MKPLGFGGEMWVASEMAVDLASAAAALDLEHRVASIPPTACIRGVFFQLLRDEMRRRHLVIPAVSRLVERTRSYGLYPARDLCRAFAYAGAVVRPDAEDGMRELFTASVVYFTSTWYGRAFGRFLRPEPLQALSWIERSRDYVANYGRWRLEVRSPEHAVFHMFDEYFWMSAHQGGCEGLLAACRVQGEVHTELDDPFNGRLDIRWRLGN
jgi:uncharacterized protein (TIGR02265 family)